MCKYEMDPMSIVEDTERTRFCPQTDRRTRWNQYTPLSTSLKRGVSCKRPTTLNCLDLISVTQWKTRCAISESDYWLILMKYRDYLNWILRRGIINQSVTTSRWVVNHSRDHFVYGLSQWETMLQCNIVSHWLSPYTRSPQNRLLPLGLMGVVS